MCLDFVDNKPARKFGVGYKIVRKKTDGTYVCFDYTPNEGKVSYPLNEWITDPNDGEARRYGVELAGYRTGFHISLDKRMMTALPVQGPEPRVIKVRFRKVVATSIKEPCPLYGEQVVAREIMNLGEVE